jgi:hypothetical protein
MSELGQKIIEGVRAAAAGRPDYIYPKDGSGCWYIRDYSPSCLVGHALWAAGLIDEDWRGDDYGAIADVVLHEKWPLDEDEVHWLSTVQKNQDIGRPWGDAVAIADDKSDDDPER